MVEVPPYYFNVLITSKYMPFFRLEAPAELIGKWTAAGVVYPTTLRIGALLLAVLTNSYVGTGAGHVVAIKATSYSSE
jgi:hypothetical protein